MKNNTFNPEYFIEYANANTRFFVKRKQFSGPNAFDDAVKWGRENMHNFNVDMINLK
jgi:hypothetical protein